MIKLNFKQPLNKQAILDNRNFLMGTAMLLVLMYHFTCWIGYRKLLLPFNWGFIGVDIFLFLSAIGLGISVSNRPYKEFIKRRLIRIMPLYIFAATVDSLFYLFKEGKETLSVWDWFCNLTSLSYYGVGGYLRDWYLSSLLLLYVIYPALMLYVNKYKMGGVICSLLLSALFISMIDMPFQYNCFISRLPIFLFGIFVYHEMSHSTESLRSTKYAYITCTLGIIAFLYANISNPDFLFISTALLAPTTIVLCIKSIKYIPQNIQNIICYVGNYSLEFYIANLCIHCVLDLTISIHIKIIVYILGNVLFALILIPLNRICRQVLSNSPLR